MQNEKKHLISEYLHRKILQFNAFLNKYEAIRCQKLLRSKKCILYRLIKIIIVKNNDFVIQKWRILRPGHSMRNAKLKENHSVQSKRQFK